MKSSIGLSSIGLMVSALLMGCSGVDPTNTTAARTSTIEANLSREGSSHEPLPVPGGTVFAPGLPLLHVFAPGPTPGYAGINVEPATITNFKGLSMIAEDYTLTATATGSDGTSYLLGTDMRVLRGTYRTSTGEHHATFVLI